MALWSKLQANFTATGKLKLKDVELAVASLRIVPAEPRLEEPGRAGGYRRRAPYVPLSVARPTCRHLKLIRRSRTRERPGWLRVGL